MKVQTVLGPVDSDDLGRTLMHEHLYIAFPGAEFDPSTSFDRPAVVAACVAALIDIRDNHGVRTVVDPCPIELGRNADLLREIAEKAEVNVVCTTGFYTERLGMPTYWRARTVDEIAEVYITELTRGINGTGVLPGAIKAATGIPVSRQEEKFLRAAAIAQKETGVIIITHTDDGLGGPEQQAIFRDAGVPLDRCLIGHSCENPDYAYHLGIIETGSYVGFDRIGYQSFQSDAVRADNIAAIVKAGHKDKVILSHDSFVVMRGRSSRTPSPEEAAKIAELRAAGDYPLRPSYMFRRFLPLLLERGVSEAAFWSMLDDNPRRLFGG